MATQNNRRANTFDNLLLLKDAGAVTATGAATVASVARVIDVGEAYAGNVKAVVDSSALVGTGTYTLAIQGSVDAAFTAPVQLAALTLTATGRNAIPFSNVQNNEIYRFIRAFITVGGTSPSINNTIFIAKD